MRILCVGIMVMDLLASPVTVEGLRRDSSRLKAFELLPGGDAMNTAMELAALGVNVSLVGCLGDDTFGYSLMETAQDAGVDISGVLIKKECATSCTLVAIDEHSERHFFSYGDSFRHLMESDVSDAQIQGSDLVHVGSAMVLDSLDGEGLANLFKRARSQGAKTSMDVTSLPGKEQFQKVEQALYHTNFFLPSLYECKLMCGSSDISDIKAFFEKYGIEILVIKMGDKGCFATNFKRDIYMPAVVPADKVVDTTGAGDSFVAGFLYGTMRGMQMEQALRFGTAMSAVCIQTIGASKGVMDEKHRLKRLADEIIAEY